MRQSALFARRGVEKNLGVGRARARGRGEARAHLVVPAVVRTPRARSRARPSRGGVLFRPGARLERAAEEISGPVHRSPEGRERPEPCESLDRLGGLQPANEAEAVFALGERRLAELRDPTDGEQGEEAAERPEHRDDRQQPPRHLHFARLLLPRRITHDPGAGFRDGAVPALRVHEAHAATRVYATARRRAGGGCATHRARAAWSEEGRRAMS